MSTCTASGADEATVQNPHPVATGEMLTEDLTCFGALRRGLAAL
jgi:hypothetical protein